MQPVPALLSLADGLEHRLGVAGGDFEEDLGGAGGLAARSREKGKISYQRPGPFFGPGWHFRLRPAGSRVIAQGRLGRD
jgi:hypothetical protein